MQADLTQPGVASSYKHPLIRDRPKFMGYPGRDFRNRGIKAFLAVKNMGQKLLFDERNLRVRAYTFFSLKKGRGHYLYFFIKKVGSNFLY